MAFLIRRIERTADGREIVRERRSDRDLLTVGRAADNDIVLPDLAVALHQASLAQVGPGRVHARSLGGQAIRIDGVRRDDAELACARGGEIELGSWRLALFAAADGDCGIEMREVLENADALDQRRSFSLSGLLPGRRPMAWLAALAILIAFLLVPIVTHQRNQADRKVAVIGDASWRPGALSLAHHALEGTCETCHAKGFVAVNDTTCRSCHKDVHDHADLTRLARARAELGWGRRLLDGVSDAFGKPRAGACVDCHVEHQGPGPMPLPPQKFCADCHGTLKSRLTDTALGDAGDFGRVHPQFRPAIVVDAASRKVARVSLGMGAREDNGLTFSHKEHLAAAGGVARMAISLGMARGYGKRLDCASCHRPTDDRVGYLPIVMERDCAACHSLAYDRIGGTIRRLRHGDIPQTLADLAVSPGASRAASGAVLEGRRRPGEYAPGGLYYNRFGSGPVGGGAAGLAFGRGGICSECHTAVRTGAGFGVMPVTLLERYLGKSAFDHRAHRQSACKDCHAAAGSTSASDLLLPEIATCRTCHGGDTNRWAKVPSGCAMCHSYHPPNFARRRKDDGAGDDKLGDGG